MNFNVSWDYLIQVAINFGLKILGAIVVLIVGRWIIGIVVRLVKTALERQWKEPTLVGYAGTLISVLFNLALFVAILGYFGFETTTFAALLAGVGLAIGTAWGGLLAHFAAGIFLIVLRPFKVGDDVTAGGVTGTVKEIGLFVTRIHTGDNVVSYVGNNKIFSDNIQNYTDATYRRVEIKTPVPAGMSTFEFIGELRARLEKIPNVLAEPAPEIAILEIKGDGATVAVRPFTSTANFSQVQFDASRIIVEMLEANKKPSDLENLARVLAEK